VSDVQTAASTLRPRATAPVIEVIGGMGDRLSRITQRWIPDSWVVCMAITLLAMGLAVIGPGASVNEVVLAWGGGMWSLLELSMQFSLALVAAYACVSSRPVFRLLDRLAGIPRVDKPVQAVVLVGLFSLVSAYLNWALSIVACALFLPFVFRRNPRADVRVLIAAAYLGIGTVFHGGLSGSAPLIMATPGNPLLSPAVGEPVIDRLMPITETLFIPFNLIYLATVAAVSLVVVSLLHPRRNAYTLTSEQVDRMIPTLPETADAPKTPAEKMDSFRGWTVVAALLIAYPLGYSFVTRGFGATWTINAYNMTFLAAALLLQGRPSDLVRAVTRGTTTASGIILQFPFYAGIFGVINNTGLGSWLGECFVQVATTETFPLVVYVYSAFMNMFVPSAGSKWLIEAPYLLLAAKELGVSATTTVLAYAYGDSTTNLIQPFWAIPLLAVTGLRFGDIVGFTGLVALVVFVLNIVTMLVIPVSL
jgi:short-chain fatty acids transporter